MVFFWFVYWLDYGFEGFESGFSIHVIQVAVVFLVMRKPSCGGLQGLKLFTHSPMTWSTACVPSKVVTIWRMYITQTWSSKMPSLH